MQVWLPGAMAEVSNTYMLQASGDLHLAVTYKPFEDDDTDSGYREAEAYALLLQQQAITDVKVRLSLNA